MIKMTREHSSPNRDEKKTLFSELFEETLVVWKQ